MSPLTNVIRASINEQSGSELQETKDYVRCEPAGSSPVQAFIVSLQCSKVFLIRYHSIAQ